MRLGRVQITNGYVVDLDNENMVQEAKDALFEDFSNSILKYPVEFDFLIEFKEESGLTEEDIPEFLKDYE